MTPDQASNVFNILQLGLLIKLFLTTLAIFYFIFTLVVYRQVQLMTQVLESKISPMVKTLAMVQIGMAGLLTLLALVLG